MYLCILAAVTITADDEGYERALVMPFHISKCVFSYEYTVP